MVILGPRWLFSSTNFCSLNPPSARVYTNSVCLYCAGGEGRGGGGLGLCEVDSLHTQDSAVL